MVNRATDSDAGVRIIRAGDRTGDPAIDPGGDAVQGWLAHGIAELTHAPTGTRTAGFELVEFAPGQTSGRHHHGGQETLIAVLAGQLRIVWTSPATGTAEAGPGDLLIVAPWVHHAESNPGTEPLQYALYGQGAATITV